MLIELRVRGALEQPSREGTIERARDWRCRRAGTGASDGRRAASARRVWSCTMVVWRPVCRCLSLWPTSIRKAVGPLKAVTGVCGGSGQSHPYVRPVARPPPLAIMDVRMRVRRQSGWRARGTRLSTASP